MALAQGEVGQAGFGLQILMPEIAGPLARVLLRYFGAFLVTQAGLHIDLSDPDVASVLEFVIGGLISGGAELWWYFARKHGWST